MRRITRDDAIKAVGATDDFVIAQIIGTGATTDELAEAQAWIANDEIVSCADCLDRVVARDASHGLSPLQGFRRTAREGR